MYEQFDGIMDAADGYKNHIILTLSSEDWKYLQPYLEYKEFKSGALSEQRGPDDFYIYFVLTGIFALTIRVDEQDIAIALFGHDSLIDTTVPLDVGLNEVRVTCLTPLTVFALPAQVAKALLPQLPSLHPALMTATRNMVIKIARATACIKHHSNHQRLAKWLLRASDLTQNPRLEISHQVLAQMLGIRRAGATVELGKLKAAGAITTGYGWIEIKDRDVLEQHACSCYRASTLVLQP